MVQDNSKHIPILDGIRAFAVILVCIVHFFQVDEAGLYLSNKYLGAFLFKTSQIGLRGVELFFLLSGFLITGILLDSKKSSKYFSTFYSRRFLRIFPLYYFVLTFSFLVLPHIIGIDIPGKELMQKQTWLWTYTSNLSGFFGHVGWDNSLNFPSFGHFWSLCVEEHFYIFWPLLVFFSNEKWLPRIMWSIVAISVFSVLFVYFSNDLIPILKWTTIRCAGVLSLGGLVAFYRKNTQKYQQIISISKRLVLPVGILFFLVNFIPRKFEILDVVTFFLSVLFFLFLIVIALEGNKTTKHLFNHKALFFIGKISYGIYVYHGMLRPYFKEFIYTNLHSYISNGILASIFYTIVCTGISIFIAWLNWILIESPILKLKKYFNY